MQSLLEHHRNLLQSKTQIVYHGLQMIFLLSSGSCKARHQASTIADVVPDATTYLQAFRCLGD